MTHFQRACALWDNIAGSFDWEAFAESFDRAIQGLTDADIEAIDRFIEQRREARASQPVPDQVVSESQKRVETA